MNDAAYESKGDEDKAIADYTEAIRLDPKDAISHFNRGVVYGNKGSPRASTSLWRQFSEKARRSAG